MARITCLQQLPAWPQALAFNSLVGFYVHRGNAAARQVTSAALMPESGTRVELYLHRFRVASKNHFRRWCLKIQEPKKHMNINY
eukprot:3717434-Amphidinium_carterae.1